MSSLLEQADSGNGTYHRYLKRKRNKLNRAKNKRNCKALLINTSAEKLEDVSYKHFNGYES